jgi:hypothetical protein
VDCWGSNHLPITWSSLTEQQRADVLVAVENGESVDEVARRFNLKSSSLSRKLRSIRSSEDVARTDDGTQIVQSKHMNTATISIKSARITTLDQLLAVCEVDSAIWEVDRYVVNKWEVGAKSEQKDLTWADGVVSGSVQSGGMEVEPLFQVKAWLVRREPIALFPTIQPVRSSWTLAEFEKSAAHPVPSRGDGVYRSFVWADPQIGFVKDLNTAELTPFHDRRALDVALQIMAACGPNRVDGLGDAGDFAMWTDKYVRSPEFQHTTQPSLCELHWWLSQMRRIVGRGTPIKLHQGNHEARVDNYLMLHLREAYDLRAVDEMELPPALSVQRLLALQEIGVEWIGDYPDDEDWLNDRICVSHGDTARSPGNTAKAVVSETDGIRVIGHIHRAEVAIRAVHTRVGDRVALCCCVPCLCHTDGRVPGSDKRDQWQQGVVIVDYEDSGGYSITTIPIEDGRAVWNRQTFVGRDRTDEIAVAWPQFNWL